MPHGSAANTSSSVLFLHVRKTGGLSVRNMLAQRFAVNESLLDWHNCQNAGLAPDSYRFITGHCSFSVIQKFSDEPCTIVFLRSPVERALSAYFFYRRNTPEFLRHLRDTLPTEIYTQRERFTREANRKDILRFLKEEEDLARFWLSDVQTRVLAGATDGEPEPYEGEELLREANRNLSRCAVVGLTERMSESIELLCRYRNWRPPVRVRHDNRAIDRPSANQLPPEAVQILTEWNNRDMRLYRAAERMLDHRIRAAGQATPAASPHDIDLPLARDYTFDQAIVGEGWYLREFHNGRWICWTGYGWEATLRLRLESMLESMEDQCLECRLEHVLNSRVLGGLRIVVNQTPVNWRLEHRGNDRWICATVPGHAFPPRSPNVVIRFIVAERVQPCAVNPGVQDSRQLGIALGRIRLGPDARQTGK